MARITPAALENERIQLNRNHPPRKLPYGQAWLLLMLQELSSRPVGRSPEAQALRRETEERVVNFLERYRFPEYRSGYSREHTSWLFAYMMLRLSQPSAGVLSRIQALQSRVEANRTQVEAQTQNTPRDFLYLPAVLSLLDQISPARAPTRSRYSGPAMVLPAVTESVGSHNAHQCGAVMVSVWAHALQSGRGDLESCELFHRTLNSLFADLRYWAFQPNQVDTFVSVGHWVPQFMWMGIWLELGMP